MEKHGEARERTAGERGRGGTGLAAALIGRALAALGILAGLAGGISALTSSRSS